MNNRKSEPTPTYGYSMIGGDTSSKRDALNEAVRRYGALPIIQLIQYPDSPCIPIDGPHGEEPKILTFRLERYRSGYKYVEQLEQKEKCDKRSS